MKRAVAIVLSLILIGIQAMAAVQTTSASGLIIQKASACCQTGCCCVTESASAPQSLPASTAPVAPQNNFPAVLSALVAWTLPDSASLQFLSPSSAPCLAIAVPLFKWDCALLI